MWRLYTPGWGPRAWWFWFRTEGFPMSIAWWLPRRIALWTFIRVYAADGQAPGPEYVRVFDAWERGEGEVMCYTSTSRVNRGVGEHHCQVTDLAPIVMCYTSAIRMRLWVFVTYYVWAFLLCCRLIVRGA